MRKLNLETPSKSYPDFVNTLLNSPVSSDGRTLDLIGKIRKEMDCDPIISEFY